MEDVEADFFGGFSIHNDPDNQRKDNSVRLLVKGIESTLITPGDSSDEPQPLVLRYPRLRLIGVENLAERLSNGWSIPDRLGNRRTHTKIVLGTNVRVKKPEKERSRSALPQAASTYAIPA